MSTYGIAVPGTVVPSGSQASPAGAQGIQGTAGSSGSAGAAGANSWTLSTASFTVPNVGSTAVMSVNDASWAVVGEFVWVATAGGSANVPMALQVTAKTSTSLTLLNPPTSGMQVSSDAGNLLTLGSDSFAYLSKNTVLSAIPPGVVWEYSGTSLPAGGWLWADGSAVSRTTYAALYAAIGTTFGIGDGSTTFNVPDRRGRVGIGVGSGTGLTSRVLAANGGEETHQLTVAELASHVHVTGNSGGNITVTAGGYTVIVPGGSTNAAGGDGAHNNMQPFLVQNYIIKT